MTAVRTNAVWWSQIISFRNFRDPDPTVAKATCLRLAPEPASAAGQMLNNKNTIPRNGVFIVCSGAPSRDRTLDLLLKRELLYRLS